MTDIGFDGQIAIVTGAGHGSDPAAVGGQRALGVEPSLNPTPEVLP